MAEHKAASVTSRCQMYLTLSAVTVALRSHRLSPETIANRHTHAADPEVALRTPTRPWLLNYWSTIVILWVESVGFQSFTDHRTRNLSPRVVSALTTATTSSIFYLSRSRSSHIDTALAAGLLVNDCHLMGRKRYLHTTLFFLAVRVLESLLSTAK